MSFSDVQPLLYQTENDMCETKIKKCSVCGTCEDLVSLLVTQKGYPEEVNLQKTMCLLSFLELSRKMLQTN